MSTSLLSCSGKETVSWSNFFCSATLDPLMRTLQNKTFPWKGILDCEPCCRMCCHQASFFRVRTLFALSVNHCLSCTSLWYTKLIVEVRKSLGLQSAQSCHGPCENKKKKRDPKRPHNGEFESTINYIHEGFLSTTLTDEKTSIEVREVSYLLSKSVPNEPRDLIASCYLL